MKIHLPSFDGNENVTSELLRPDRYRHLFESVTSSTRSIARGSGLSYCGASAGEFEKSVSTRAFNRILNFDSVLGLISVEPGLEIGELMLFARSKGWVIPVMPGHPRITLGGCVGVNVHGKSQFHGGNFGEWVRRLFLFHPDHGELECSQTVLPELFNLTIGGFGLTGYITRIDLQLTKLKGERILIRKVTVDNLLDAVDVMQKNSGAADFLYSWNDLNQRGSSFGKGLVYVESVIEGSTRAKGSKAKTFKTLNPEKRGKLPFSMFNSMTVPLAMRIYQLKERVFAREVILDFQTASFPLNGKEIYFNLYGRPGFREYQLIVPVFSWENCVSAIQSLIFDHKVPVALGSLKLFKGKTTLLNFCADGICLAIDIPSTKNGLEFFRALDQLVLKLGGILNIAKDSRVSALTIQEMYPGYREFKDGLRNFDPSKRFSSALRRRLDV